MIKQIYVLLGILFSIAGRGLAQVAVRTDDIRMAAPRPPAVTIGANPEGKWKWKEFKVTNPGKKLLITFGDVYIEGYNGRDVIFLAKVEDKEEDERAKGLRMINGSGQTDNSGIGLFIQTKENVTQAAYVGSFSKDSIRIRVPNNMTISVASAKNSYLASLGSDIELRDITQEIEVSSTISNVKVINVTGPTNIKVAQGDIEARFKTPVKGPISLVTAVGAVDVALPVKLGANVDVRTAMGNIYSADEFRFEQEGVSNGDVQSFNNCIKGKINGGGQDIILKTSVGDVYIRTNNK